MISLKFIEPGKNRYVTNGDWVFDKKGNLLVTATAFGNKDGSFLVALHELVEAWLCQHDDVAEEDVSAWDLCNPDAEEPGEVPGAPYFKQHAIATKVERIVCEALGLDWDDHNRWVAAAADEVESCLNTPPSNSPED